MLEQEELTSGPEHAVNLLEAANRVWYGAEHEARAHRVEGSVLERKPLNVRYLQVGLGVSTTRSLQHSRGEIDPRDVVALLVEL